MANDQGKGNNWRISGFDIFQVSWIMDQGTGNRDQGTGIREQGKGDCKLKQEN